MSKPGLGARIALFLAGGLVLSGLMGQGCPGFNNGGAIDEPVTVELANVTSNDVDAFLWASPDTLFTPDEVGVIENLVDVGDPLAPDELATLTLDCVDAGTFLADGDLLVNFDAPVPSFNLILVREGEHFFCGDTVSFFYELDQDGTFFISVDVNGTTIAP